MIEALIAVKLVLAGVVVPRAYALGKHPQFRQVAADFVEFRLCGQALKCFVLPVVVSKVADLSVPDSS